jgi:hypothetical protein
MRADGVKLFVNNGSHFSHVVVAPLNLVHIIVRQSLSQDVLHLTDDVFRGLAVFATLLKSFVCGLLPNGDEGCKVTLVCRIGEGIAHEVFWL